MSESCPLALRSIPELYIFEPDEGCWQKLECVLRRVVVAAATKSGISFELKDELYKCTQKQWRQRKFPLGSDGEPPRASNPQQRRASRRLLGESTAALLSDLEISVDSRKKFANKVANRLHMPLTWLFTGCPERTVEILMDAIVNPRGAAGRTLQMDNEYSAWSIYSGVGRAVRSDEALTKIFDTLLGEWESGGGERQDKFLLAAVTHPMARRVAVRRALNASRDRFERVKHFLDQHLENLLRGIHDLRPNGKKPGLELSYVTMGYRGLCQLRYTNRDWFPEDGEEARVAFTKLCQAARLGRAFERDLVKRTAPYLIGEGEDPSMPGGF